MRLLNAKTFDFHDFHRKPPPYAILSHTWGRTEDEVSYRDIDDSTETRRKAWHQKVVPCAERAVEDGYDYIWIDTCCINKRDAVEFSEAINSMYRWYQRAQACYVVLLDVPAQDTDPQAKTSKFCQSRWFTRGWTLQELLAPRDVYFFNAGWEYLGSRDDLSILIWSITGIEPKYLADNDAIKEASVATRMYWASRRETRRPEDRSYSLLGLFGIYMSPIYGEGAELAFKRLQEQILRRLPDDSILAWGIISPEPGPSLTMNRSPSSLLAQSPSDFMFSGDIETAGNSDNSDFYAASTCIMTTTSAWFQIRAYRRETEAGYGYIKLNCRLRSAHQRGSEYFSVGVPIAWDTRDGSDVCFRVRHPTLILPPAREGMGEEQTVHLNVSSYSILVQPLAQAGIFQFRWDPADVKITAVCPESAWEEDTSAFVIEAGPAIMAVRFRSATVHKKDYIVLVVSPTRELTTYTRWLVMEDTENTPLELVVGSQHFHRAKERLPVGCSLTREIGIRATQHQSLARHTYEVLAGEPGNPPRPAMEDAATRMEYLRMQREVVAIDREIKKLLDSKSRLTARMKEMEQELLQPALLPDGVQRADRHRLPPPSRAESDAFTPRTSFQELVIHDDGGASDSKGGNVYRRQGHHTPAELGRGPRHDGYRAR